MGEDEVTTAPLCDEEEEVPAAAETDGEGTLELGLEPSEELEVEVELSDQITFELEETDVFTDKSTTPPPPKRSASAGTFSSICALLNSIVLLQRERWEWGERVPEAARALLRPHRDGPQELAHWPTPRLGDLQVPPGPLPLLQNGASGLEELCPAQPESQPRVREA